MLILTKKLQKINVESSAVTLLELDRIEDTKDGLYTLERTVASVTLFYFMILIKITYYCKYFHHGRNLCYYT